MELTSKQRRYLQKKAHSLKPVVYLGKQGVNDQTVKAVCEALAHHELIKVKCVSLKEYRTEILHDIAQQSEACLVSVIGNIGILYKENPDKSAYHLPD